MKYTLENFKQDFCFEISKSLLSQGTPNNCINVLAHPNCVGTICMKLIQPALSEGRTVDKTSFRGRKRSNFF